MPSISRREFVRAAALLGASTLIGETEIRAASPAEQPTSQPHLPSGNQKENTDRLLQYFGGNGPKLLRPAQGVLEQPSIACSLPGRQYATSLWDWDTYWTARGLFQLARIANDSALKKNVADHAIGSLVNFFNSQSEEGRLPIMLDVKNADPLGTLKKDRPRSQNQAKPVFGQLALLVSDQTGSADWFAPHFDKLLRFYDSWTSQNQSAVGLLVWGNDVAIGNDNDPTTFGRPLFLLPICC